MRRRLGEESGFALVTAIFVLAIIMALGMSAMKFADIQQHAAGAERTRESGFNQAEAVLDAQVFQLSRTWPSAASPATWQCQPTTAGAGTTATTCPDPASLSATFTSVDYTPVAGCALPAWETIVQDDDPANGGTQFYDPVAMNPATHAQVPYDANGNNAVWVRASTAARCRRQTLVALATRAMNTVQWPLSVLSADWFKTGNNGNKVIINTQGPDANRQPGNVSVRCTASGHTGSACKQYKPGQVAPDTIPSSPAGGTPVLNGTQIASLREQAKASSTWYSGCPGSVALGALAPGTVVFIEGSAGCTTTASGNTATNAVSFVINDGKFTLGGNSKFFGLLYAINASNQNTTIVTLSGCAKIQGLVAVDGLGGVNVGQCKQNLVFDPTILSSVRTFGGAVAAKNSFRVLPGTAP
jgi:hypothetical protein